MSKTTNRDFQVVFEAEGFWWVTMGEETLNAVGDGGRVSSDLLETISEFAKAARGMPGSGDATVFSDLTAIMNGDPNCHTIGPFRTSSEAFNEAARSIIKGGGWIGSPVTHGQFVVSGYPNDYPEAS